MGKRIIAGAVVALALTSCVPHPIPTPSARPSILRYLPGIRATESGGQPEAVGDDGRSVGAYQLNEDYHAERAARFGAYDPKSEPQARRVAAGILAENYAAITRASRVCDPDTWADRREELAIASYRQGLHGVALHGAAYWYVNRVKEAAR